MPFRELQLSLLLNRAGRCLHESAMMFCALNKASGTTCPRSWAATCGALSLGNPYFYFRLGTGGRLVGSCDIPLKSVIKFQRLSPECIGLSEITFHIYPSSDVGLTPLPWIVTSGRRGMSVEALIFYVSTKLVSRQGQGRAERLVTKQPIMRIGNKETAWQKVLLDRHESLRQTSSLSPLRTLLRCKHRARSIQARKFQGLLVPVHGATGSQLGVAKP